MLRDDENGGARERTLRWAARDLPVFTGGHTLQSVARVKELMHVGDADMAALVQQQPGFLDCEGVQQAIEELARLMPQGTDTLAMLRNDPSFLLRLQRGQKYLGENPDADPETSYLQDNTSELAKIREERERGQGRGAGDR